MDMEEMKVRMDELLKELAVIYKTLEAIKYLAGTVNAETYSRCMAITVRLQERVNLIDAEWKSIQKEIENSF